VRPEEARARLAALGFGDDDVDVLAQHFLTAEGRGRIGHGVSRIEWLETWNELHPDARPERVVAAVLLNTESHIDPGALAVDLAERAADAFPAEPEPWKPGEAAPAEIAGVLGHWWSEGSEFVFSWRNGRLEARSPDDPPELEPAVFAPDGDGRFRTVSGRERGERLDVVRDADGTVTKLYWATYPFTRDPRPFSSPA
jgi:hypothetical protein